MRLPNALLDLVLAAAAGYIGTKVMEPVSMRLYELEPVAARQREDAARPGPPYRVAAEKLTTLIGLELTEAQLDRLSLVLHYGLAAQWAPLYPLLRRRAGLGPVAAGLATGAVMSVVADELMTPAFGFSAPNLDYPLVTHARGFAAHPAFGVAVAATIEAGWAATGRRP
jgi:hypothetical protein